MTQETIKEVLHDLLYIAQEAQRLLTRIKEDPANTKIIQPTLEVLTAAIVAAEPFDTEEVVVDDVSNSKNIEYSQETFDRINNGMLNIAGKDVSLDEIKADIEACKAKGIHYHDFSFSWSTVQGLVDMIDVLKEKAR